MTSDFETFVSAIAKLDRRDRHGVLGEEELIFPPDPAYGYWATPQNALTFGAMGVDGVHYVILTKEGRAENQMPIIQVAPMDFSAPYTVYATSFLEFLAFACGAPKENVKSLISRQHEGTDDLVPFLKSNFRLHDRDHDAIFDDAHQSKLAYLIDLIQRNPEHK